MYKSEVTPIPQKSRLVNVLEILFLTGLFARLLVSGKIYYWSNYFFLVWFCLLYLAALLAKKTYFKLPAMLSLGLLLFFGGLIISMPFGLQPLQSARELIIFLGYLFIFLSGVEICNSRSITPVAWALLAAALVQACFGLSQYLGGLERSALMDATVAGFEQVSLKRIFGFTFSPDFFACFLSAALVIWTGGFQALAGKNIKSRSTRIITFAFFAVLLFGMIILSRSMGGFLALLAGIFSLAAMKLGKKYPPRKIAAIFLAVSIFAALVFSLFVYQRRQYFFSSQNPIVLRLYNFESGLKVFLEKPALGAGVGNFWIAYPKYRPLLGNETRYAHNNFIQVLAESGPIAEIGMLILIAYLLLAAKKIADSGDALLMSVWSGLFVVWSAWLWDFGLYAPELASVFFVLFAAVVTGVENAEEKKAPALTLGLLALLSAVLCFVSLWIFAEQRLVKKVEFEFSYGDPKTAKALALKAIKMMPIDDYPEIVMAWSLAREKADAASVLSHYRRAIQLNPRFAFWHRELGDYYVHDGELKLAEFEYLNARELYPYSPDLLARLAKVCRLQGNLNQAEQFGMTALSAAGGHQNALWEMVWIKLARGGDENRAQAVKYLKELEQNYHDPGARAALNKMGAGGGK